MDKLTKFEWSILDSLSDGIENVALILPMMKDEFPDTTRKDVAEVIYKLHKHGLVFEDKGKHVDYRTVTEEPSEYVRAVYWFGMTEAGASCWEQYAAEYSGEPVGWSRACEGHIDLEHEGGWVIGTSKGACLAWLEELEDPNKAWQWDKVWHSDEPRQVDMSTLVHSEVEGFKPKYYKYLKGGHCIVFKLKKRQA